MKTSLFFFSVAPPRVNGGPGSNRQKNESDDPNFLFSISNAPTHITPGAHRFGHVRVLPGQHCPHTLPFFLVSAPHGGRGGCTSSMCEVDAKSPTAFKSMPVADPSKQKRSATLRVTSTTDAFGTRCAASDTSDVPLQLVCAAAARLRRDGGMDVGRVHAADQVAPSADHHGEQQRYIELHGGARDFAVNQAPR